VLGAHSSSPVNSGKQVGGLIFEANHGPGRRQYKQWRERNNPDGTVQIKPERCTPPAANPDPLPWPPKIQSGSRGIMAFEPELDRLVHPHLSYVKPGGNALPLVEIGKAISRHQSKQEMHGEN
jgi:hypothetical protein